MLIRFSDRLAACLQQQTLLRQILATTGGVLRPLPRTCRSVFEVSLSPGSSRTKVLSNRMSCKSIQVSAGAPLAWGAAADSHASHLKCALVNRRSGRVSSSCCCQRHSHQCPAEDCPGCMPHRHWQHVATAQCRGAVRVGVALAHSARGAQLHRGKCLPGRILRGQGMGDCLQGWDLSHSRST